MQHAAGSNTAGWTDRNGTSVFPNTKATLAWLTDHFGGKCFVDPEQVYESSFAIHEGNSKKDPPIYAQFFPDALDRNGNSVKYRLRISGEVVQGVYPTEPNSTTVIECPTWQIFKDTGKGKAACEQKDATTFPNGDKVVLRLTL